MGGIVLLNRVISFGVPIVLVFTLLSGCLSTGSNLNTHSVSGVSINVSRIVNKCVSLCLKSKELGENLSAGPCLSNNISYGWVCDVAHWPRQPVDNMPANQCPAFGKTAHAFVEVSPDCKPIRVWDGHRLYISY